MYPDTDLHGDPRTTPDDRQVFTDPGGGDYVTNGWGWLDPINPPPPPPPPLSDSN